MTQTKSDNKDKNKQQGTKVTRTRGRRDSKAQDQEYDQEIIDLARVTRVMAGGKRMRFRACIGLGNKKGKVAVALAKGADVPLSVNKAVSKAKKKFITVPIVNDTIPYRVQVKYKAAVVLLKPAPKGTGVKAGSSVRTILTLAGVPNVVARILRSNNKVVNAMATIKALELLQEIPVAAKGNKPGSDKKSGEKPNKEEKKEVKKSD